MKDSINSGVPPFSMVEVISLFFWSPVKDDTSWNLVLLFAVTAVRSSNVSSGNIIVHIISAFS
jgi:hypothetical protein